MRGRRPTAGVLVVDLNGLLAGCLVAGHRPPAGGQGSWLMTAASFDAPGHFLLPLSCIFHLLNNARMVTNRIGGKDGSAGTPFTPFKPGDRPRS